MDIWRWKEGVSENYSHMEMWRLDRKVRDWRNDKCVGQSIRSCQADGKLESGLTLRQIDTIRYTKMYSRWRVCVRVHMCVCEKTSGQINTHKYGEKEGQEGREEEGNRKHLLSLYRIQQI